MSNTVTLERDGHDQPWGFRLQGGVDVGLPLSVLRVLVGTPAESVLKKGDVITKIGARGTHGLSHQQAVELFNSAGNQIEVTFKRSGGAAPSPAPSVLSALHASTAVRTAQPAPPSAENPSVQALPRTTFVLKSELPAYFSAPTVATDDSDKFSVQNQPYRTTPLVQPTAKAITELGIGSYTHLRLQEEICSGVREPQLVPVTPAQANALKANEYIMKQKTQQGLVNAASDHQRSAVASPPPSLPSGPIVGPSIVKLPPAPTAAVAAPAAAPTAAKYNSAAGLYANQSGGYLNKKPGMITPSRGSSGPPAAVILTPNLDYNPTQSPTWLLLRETENPPTLEELQTPDMNPHDPIYSEVYSAPRAPTSGAKPIRPGFKGGSPVGGSSMLSPGPQMGSRMSAPQSGSGTPPPQGALTPVAAAALAEPAPPNSRGRSPRDEHFPLYETNSIGGRRRIAQSSSFNKLMFNMLGE